MEIKYSCYFFGLLATSFPSFSTAFSRDYFTAAVFEHARQDNWTADSPEDIVLSNLQNYETAIAVAKNQDVDLIIFPEYGIIPPIHDRLEIKKYLELIPNPKIGRVTPCDEIDQYTGRPILFALSCMAKRNEIVVVANIGGREPCQSEPDCPDGGEFHFNANVAFDQNGTLVGRYYKEYLYYEFIMDVPKEKQNPVFETNFGKFATFIGFNIMFKKMAEVSQLPDVDAILFSAWWFNSSPYFTSIQWWQAWAMGNNATILAANIQSPGLYATGSGVYRGREGSLVSTFNPDGISKLVVTTIPKRGRNIFIKSNIIAITENEIEECNDNGKDLPSVCSYNMLGKPKNILKDYRCFDDSVANYTLQKLTGSEGYAEVCNEGICCQLHYSANSMNESFYLGVFNGTRSFSERYFFSEESCFVARCDDINGTSCSNFAMYSKTLFHRFFLRANFWTKFVYPSVMSSGMELVPVQKWYYSLKTNATSIQFNSSSGIRLLRATLLGRPYERDPPYVR